MPRFAENHSNRSILFYAHIGGMDAFAKGLKIAAAIRAGGRVATNRQGPVFSQLGQRHRGEDRSPVSMTLSDLENHTMLDKGEVDAKQ